MVLECYFFLRVTVTVLSYQRLPVSVEYNINDDNDGDENGNNGYEN